MKCMSTQDVLYVQTAISSEIAMLIQHDLYQITLPSTTEKRLITF
nr:hypothetical protein [Staphylococcus saccharolyticus]